ncbi:hypothetical protein [Colwellia piezophila]|uniref:hypothetical protein n=1 Tax=Colwellia piezophila TaxID=211668 RepID=UPI00036B383B|nr:hypothetical protein [Colwellia piezophila]
MKNKFNNLVKIGLYTSIILLSACGSESGLDNPGIKMGSESTVDPVTLQNFNAITQVRVLIDEQGNETTELYALRSGVIADFQHVFNTQAITGIGLNATVNASVTSVIDITGTKLDPAIVPLLTQLANQRASCEVRNSSKVNLLDKEACSASGAIAICNENDSYKVDPEKTCAEQPDPYSYEYKYGITLQEVAVIEPTDVDPLDIISLRSIYTTDAYGEKLGTASEYAGYSKEHGVDIAQFSALAIQFNLGDTEGYWNKAFQAIINVAGDPTEIVVSTVDRDPLPETPRNKFAGDDMKNVTPGKTVETMLSFTGHNTRMPVQISKSTEFELAYAIDDGEFVTLSGNESVMASCGSAGVICLRNGEQLKVRIPTLINNAIDASDPAFDAAYAFTVKVGEGWLGDETLPKYETNFSATTHAWDYVPAVEPTLLFPTLNSATRDSDKVIRGQFTITQEMKDFTRGEGQGTVDKPDVLQPVSATLQRSIDGGTTWTSLANIVIAELTDENGDNVELSSNILPTSNSDVFDFSFNDVVLEPGTEIDGPRVNMFQIVATANLKYTTPSNVEVSSVSEPLKVNIEHSLADIVSFPTGSTAMLSHLRDVSINPNNGLLYMIDSTSPDADAEGKGGINNIIWKYNLDAINPPVCASVPKSTHNNSKKNEEGTKKHPSTIIQFNHARADLGGVFVKAGINLMYWNEELLNAGPQDSRQVSAFKEDAASHTPWSATSGQFDYTGRFFYMTAQGRKPGRGQCFVCTLQYETVSQDGKEVISRVRAAPSDASGRAAREEQAPTNSGPYNNGISLDIITYKDEVTDENGGVDVNIDEWLLSLDMVNNNTHWNKSGVGTLPSKPMGAMNLRKMQLQQPLPSENISYNEDTSWSEVFLKDENNDVLVINEGHSIAIDDKRQKAYIVDNTPGSQKIYQFDLSNLRTEQTLKVEKVLIDLAVTDGENKVDTKYEMLASLKMDPGADYLLGTDRVTGTVYIIDPISGDISILLRGLLTKTDPDQKVCNQ